MGSNATFIIVIVMGLLVILAIFIKCNKCVYNLEQETNLVIDNVHNHGRDTICKTEPSTPRTDTDNIEEGTSDKVIYS